jgi:hypothetical protein
MADHPPGVYRMHWKFVGWVDAIDTIGNVWSQRVVSSNILDGEHVIDWTMTKIPLPKEARVGTFVSVHRTKAGRWYVVNPSERMPRTTESQFKRAKARAGRLYRRLVDRDSSPTKG